MPDLDLAVLTSLPYRRSDGGTLPHRVDLLEQMGFRLHDSGDVAGRPIVQTLRQAPAIVRSDLTLAIFESSGHPLALLRSLTGRRAPRPPLLIVACWLAEVLATLDDRKRRLYRQAYRGVDRVVVFSPNQVPLLADGLGLDASMIRPVRYGIDEEFFDPQFAPEPSGESWLSVGRDKGRDWHTLATAARDSKVPMSILCRPQDVRGVDFPDNVHVIGRVDRPTYRTHLARARGIVIATHALAYPSGQSVVLEAMSMGKCCIVTDTLSMRPYLEPGRTASTVPLHDPAALTDALTELDRDGGRRDELGAAGRGSVLDAFTARQMWRTIADELESLARAGARAAP